MTYISSSRPLLLTLGAALALAGCTSHDANANGQALANDMAANATDAAPEVVPPPASETAAVENASTAAAPQVDRVPRGNGNDLTGQTGQDSDQAGPTRTESRRSSEDAQRENATDRSYDDVADTSYKSGDRRNREDGPLGETPPTR